MKLPKKEMFLSVFILLFSIGGCGIPPTSSANQPESQVIQPAAPTETKVPTATNMPAPSNPDTKANADVLYVSAIQNSDQSWTFSVTIYHPDRGWDDYADGWDVVLPSGEVIKPDPDANFTRTLVHPHIDEQPVTRSQSGIMIPKATPWLIVRSHDLVDGFGGREVKVDLTIGKGKDFDITPLP